MLRSGRHKLSMLKRIRPTIDAEIAILIYKTMVLPKLEYGNVIYMHGNKALRDCLQRLQNYGIKMCLYLKKHEDTNNVHRKAKLNKLQDRAYFQLLKIMN